MYKFYRSPVTQEEVDENTHILLYLLPKIQMDDIENRRETNYSIYKNFDSESFKDMIVAGAIPNHFPLTV